MQAMDGRRHRENIVQQLLDLIELLGTFSCCADSWAKLHVDRKIQIGY